MEGQQQQKEDGAQQHQHLILAHKLFLLKHHDVFDIDKLRLKEEVFCSILSNDMASLYGTLAADSVLEMDPDVLVSMRKRIDEEIKKLDEKIAADAEENLGESEVREALTWLNLYSSLKLPIRRRHWSNLGVQVHAI